MWISTPYPHVCSKRCGYGWLFYLSYNYTPSVRRTRRDHFGTKSGAQLQKGFLAGYGYNSSRPLSITYPFSVKKYMPPSWYATGGDLAYQTGATATGNPDLLEYQPYMQCQFHSTGVTTPGAFRVAIKMKWYVTAFDRLAVFQTT